ncbi:hypothetical protein LJ737_11755 [Hymenobacter sp. 15J16-1T3B]|uniref:hypothetical protein n=1 Tax=Hymenobacter sp. 15J16-1T3B TaxID=2886941 RepID=UPI001D0FBD49|nr:hypothetical protein [Hymenobacter sp. 15J16-1T3B]MCC3157916.1 hypothetical protein [Hymenobacter sp. 15J16-1T3B]
MTISASRLLRLAYLPLGWPGLFALFVAIKRLQYPSYVAMLREDPKELGMQVPHDFLFFLAGYFLFLHPLIWLLCTALLRFNQGRWPTLREVALFALCYAAFLLSSRCIPQPVSYWFMD